MWSRQIRDAYRFFRRSGLDAAASLRMARAEQRAEECGLVFAWEDDPSPDLSWAEPGEVTECLCLSVYPDSAMVSGTCLAALCGICDPDRAYARLLCAELAEDALAALTCVECGESAADYALPWDAESGTCGICVDRLKEAGVIEW